MRLVLKPAGIWGGLEYFDVVSGALSPRGLDCNKPFIFIPIQRIRTSCIQHEAIGASRTIVLLHVCAPPVLKDCLVRNRLRQCGIRVAVSECPSDLSPTHA